MSQFQKDLYQLGVTQAKKGLPLVFIDNENVGVLDTKERKQAEQLTHDIKGVLELILKKNELELNSSNMVELLMYMGFVHLTQSKGKAEINEVRSNIETFSTSKTVAVEEEQQLIRDNRPNIQNNWVTVNLDVVQKASHQELTSRQTKSLKKIQGALFHHYQENSEDAGIRGLKYDFKKHKITVMSKGKSFLNAVPYDQVKGYFSVVTDFLESPEHKLMKYTYIRTNSKIREQYVSFDKDIINKVYEGMPKVKEVLLKGKTLGTTSEVEDYKKGFLQLPDFGRGIALDGTTKDIFRQINPNNILKIEDYSNNEGKIEELYQLSRYDLEKMAIIFKSNLSNKTNDELKAILNRLNEYPSKHIVVSVPQSNENSMQEALARSAELTCEIYSSMGKKALLEFMLDNPNDFGVNTRGQQGDLHITSADVPDKDVLDDLPF